MAQKKRKHLVSAGILLVVIGVPLLILQHEVHHYLANRKLLETVGTGDLAGVRKALDEGADPDLLEDPLSVRDNSRSPLDLLREMFFGSSQQSGVAGGRVAPGSALTIAKARSLPAGIAARRQPPAVIMLAEEMGQSEIVKLLLARGANPNAARPSGMTLLMTAAVRNQPDVIQVLLDRGATIDARTRLGQTALTFAIVGNHVEVARTLLSRGASLAAAVPPAPKPPPQSPTISPSNPLELALFGSGPTSAKMVQLLLASGCDARAGDHNERLLLVLTMMGDNNQGEAAFYTGNPGMGGFASMGIAVGMNGITLGSPAATLKMLIAGGADVNAVGFGHTPLQAAALHRWADAVRLLLGHGADARTHPAGTWSALTLAAQSGSLEAVKLLLAHGADVREAGPFGRTALLNAAQSGSVESVKLLLAHGADARESDSFGHTALMNAAQSQSLESFRLLLAHGADASATDRNGQTALMFVVQSAPERMFTYVKGVTQFIPPSPQEQQRTNTAVQIIRLLLAHGANVNARDRTGKTALTLAQPTRGFTIMPGGTQRIPLQAHRPEIIAALKAAGAK